MPDVVLPPLGETVSEATLLQWLKAPGEFVARDEPLFEVETDKVTTEVPSLHEGYLVEVLIGEGEVVEIGTRLAVVEPEPPTGPSGRSPRPAAVRRVDLPADAAAETPVDGRTATATGPQPAPVASAGGVPAGRLAPRSDVLRSPATRRLVAEHGVDVTAIEGSGRDGRVTRADVEAAVAAPPPSPAAPVPAPGPSAPPPPAVEPGAARIGTRVPFSSIRRRTAEHMVRSKATSPHVLTVVEVDYERVAKVREAVGEAFRRDEGFSLTYLPFIGRAVADALRAFPHLNASVGDDELVVHPDVHLGVAVALGHEGLVVPVVRRAGDLRLRALARAIRDVAERARERTLRPDDLAGGTFTLTNPGGYGTFVGAPVIHQPQVAIISTEGISKQPVVIERAGQPDAIGIHRIGYLSMSWDHRAIDGLYAAAFLARVREHLEGRDWSAEL